tara:strand:+ start:398 stop:703 length:306 start_codon:yes stop_codon:yes gene_type:complete
MVRARTLSGGKKIWMKSVEKFLQKNLGFAFTAKEIIQNATLVTKTSRQDRTQEKLLTNKMCPTSHQLAQGIKGHKKIGRVLRNQYRGPPLMEYFWRYEDEE